MTGLDQPTALVFTPDGRMFVNERKGAVKIVQRGASQADSTPLLSLSNINTAQGERALIGLALDPDFAINRYYYVFYTAATPLRDRVSRFTVAASGDVTEAGSEIVVWQDNVDSGTNHHGGTVAFGGDGKLYISIGDHFDQTAGSAHISQRLDSYHGKILRINSDGSTPTDNPFYDGAGPNLDAIWARGLRNPFRFSFDPNNGRLYIGDVGGNNVTTSIEELNLGVSGANYGWPICEGSCSATGMTNPIFSYPHGGRDASITAGFVYRATAFPSPYQGSFFYADYAQNWIKRLTLDATGNVTGTVNFEPENGALDGPYGDIVDLKAGPDGALYYVDIGSGTVRQISYLAINHPPVISSASAGPTSGPGPVLDVTFSSTASDVDNDPLTYTWDFGDGVTAAFANPSHTYTTKGKFAARLTVSDGQSQTNSAPIYITVGNPPSNVTITAPVTGKTFRAGEVVSFSGTASDVDGVLTDSSYSWTIIFHHEGHVHPGAGPIPGASGTFTIPTTGHDFSGNTSFELILTVTDADGLQGSASTFIFPEKVNLNFNTSPSGLALSFDQETNVTTPFTRDTLVGFSHTIEAAIQQTLGGTLYDFISWSDGGSAKHVINAPAASTNYAAQYQKSNTTTSFSYPGTITIRDNTTALPYPASVNVSGMSGAISKVVVKLNGLTHTYPADLDVMLVSPTGQKVMLMSDAGGGTDVNGITLTFDATGAALPTTALATGMYLPTNYDTTTDTFPAPAPASLYSTALTAFNGFSPNGAWQLFIRDDAAVDTGALSGGYTLTITTVVDNTPPAVNTKTPPAGATGIALGMTVTAAFSESMTAATISGSTITLQGPGATSVPATVVYNAGNFTATLTPGSALTPGTTYTVTVKGGASGVKDLAGNPLPADVTWSFTTAAGGSQTQTFSGIITINDNAPATPYPASVTVSGMSGAISKVIVKLNGLTHTYPADLDILLVGPGGQKVMLMSDAGGGTDVSGITPTFDAAAAAAVPQSTAITTGTYRPTDYAIGPADGFPAPGPAAPYPTALTVFNGTSPNGNWNVFVRDDAGVDVGKILNGYTLTITTQ